MIALRIVLVLWLLVTPASALNFDGVDDIAFSAGTEITTHPLFWSCWIRREANGLSMDVASLVDDDGGSSSNYHYWALNVSAADVVGWIPRQGSASSAVAVTTATVPLDTWVLVYGGSASATSHLVGLYVPGNPAGTLEEVTSSTSRTPSGADDVNIGERRYGSIPEIAAPFNGDISQCGLWQRVPSLAERKTLQRFAPNCLMTGFVGHYLGLRDVTTMKDFRGPVKTDAAITGAVAGGMPPISECD